MNLFMTRVLHDLKEVKFKFLSVSKLHTVVSLIRIIFICICPMHKIVGLAGLAIIPVQISFFILLHLSVLTFTTTYITKKNSRK